MNREGNTHGARRPQPAGSQGISKQPSAQVQRAGASPLDDQRGSVAPAPLQPLVGRLHAGLPCLGVALRVEARCHHQSRVEHNVDNAVRKPAQQCPTRTALSDGTDLRMPSNRRQTSVQGTCELKFDAHPGAGIPVHGLSYVLFGARRDEELVAHPSPKIRRRTSSHGFPAGPSRSRRSSRRSSSAFCASVSSSSPGFASTESHKSSASWIRSATESSRSSFDRFELMLALSYCLTFPYARAGLKPPNYQFDRESPRCGSAFRQCNG